MHRGMGWRHALADTANFDRGLAPADGDPVLDLSALRELSPYGLVAMACVAAHNDRLLVHTRIVPPTNPHVTAGLVAAGFGFVVREFLCPVAGPPLPLPPPRAGGATSATAGARGRGAEPLASGALPSGSLVYGPLASGVPGRRAPVVVPPAVPLQPVHDGFEETEVAEAAAAALVGSVTGERIAVVVDALRVLGENRRRHAGSFDAYVAAAVVDGGRDPVVELAVGDGGIGVRAAEGQGGADAGDPAGDAAAIDRVLTGGDGALAVLARRVAAHGGTVAVRSGGARHTLCATGTIRARVPWLRGTVVAVTVPTGVPKVPARPVVRQLASGAGPAAADGGAVAVAGDAEGAVAPVAPVTLVDAG